MITLRVEHNVKVIGDKSLQGLQSCRKNTNDIKIKADSLILALGKSIDDKIDNKTRNPCKQVL